MSKKPPFPERKKKSILSLTGGNVQTWKESTSCELGEVYGFAAQFTRPGKSWYEPVPEKREYVFEADPNNKDVMRKTSDGRQLSVIRDKQEFDDLEFEFNERRKIRIKESEARKQIKPKIYEDIISRLSEQSLAKVKEIKDYKSDIEDPNDVEKLWTRILYVHENLVTGVPIEDTIVSLHNAITCGMKAGMTITQYKSNFDHLKKIFEASWAREKQQAFPEYFWAGVFIRNLGSQWSEYKAAMINNHIEGVGKYPSDTNVAFDQASRWRVTSGGKNRNPLDENVLAISTVKTKKKDGTKPSTSTPKDNKVESKVIMRNGKKIICHNEGCGGNHFANKCPKVKEIAKSLKDENIFVITIRESILSLSSGLSHLDVLLDSESSANVTNNPCILTNIRKKKHPVCLNGIGSMIVEMEGDSKHFGVLGFSKHVPCTILSMFKVSTMYKVDYIQEIQIIRVTLPSSQCIDFIGTEETMMYKYRLSSSYDFDVEQVSECALAVETVSGNEAMHSTRDLNRAKDARDLERRLAFPSPQDAKEMTSNILNSSVTTADLRLGHQVYSTIPEIKGKERKKKAYIHRDSAIPVQIHRSQVIHADIMFLDKQPMLLLFVRPLSLLIGQKLNEKN